MARYEERESTFFTDVLKVALGVFIGGFLAAIAYTKYISWDIERSLSRISTNTSVSFDRERQQVEMRRLQQANRALLAAADKRESAEAAQARQDEMRALWLQMYKPTPACQADPSTMPCVNAHASAHKRFTEVYGELPPRF